MCIIAMHYLKLMNLPCVLDSDRFVFLLCTRAGGLGINLTGETTTVCTQGGSMKPQHCLVLLSVTIHNVYVHLRLVFLCTYVLHSS